MAVAGLDYHAHYYSQLCTATTSQLTCNADGVAADPGSFYQKEQHGGCRQAAAGRDEQPPRQRHSHEATGSRHATRIKEGVVGPPLWPYQVGGGRLRQHALPDASAFLNPRLAISAVHARRRRRDHRRRCRRRAAEVVATV